jgi:membrane protein
MVGAVLNVVVEEALHGRVDTSRGKVYDFIERRKEQH